MADDVAAHAARLAPAAEQAPPPLQRAVGPLTEQHNNAVSSLASAGDEAAMVGDGDGIKLKREGEGGASSSSNSAESKSSAGTQVLGPKAHPSASVDGPSRSAFAQDLLHHLARPPLLQPAPGSGTLFTTPAAPANRSMWRYTAAAPDPAHLTRVLFREVPMAPFGVHWDWIDRSSYTKISTDASIISTDRGWRSARANVGVRWGAWYYEVDYLEPEQLSPAAFAATALTTAGAAGNGRSSSPMTGTGTGTASPRFQPALHKSGSASPALGTPSAFSHPSLSAPTVVTPAPIGPISAPMKDGPHLRLGWGRREASLNAPAGFDGYSYAIRDTTGQKCHLSRMAPYARRGFVPGDTIGVYIYIPPPPYVTAKMQKSGSAALASASNTAVPIKSNLPPRERHIRRKRVPIRYKGQLYFEALEYGVTKEMEHLMERSRRGLQKSLPADEGQPDIVGIDCPLSDDPVVVAAWDKAQADKKAAAAAAQQKKRRLPGQPMTTAQANLNLRQLPVLKNSFVGFSVNGEWQGVAFKDLLDFRPFHAVRQGRNTEQQRSNRSRQPKNRGNARSAPPVADNLHDSTDSSDTTSHSSAYSSDSSTSSPYAVSGGRTKERAGNSQNSSSHHHNHQRRSESPDAIGKSSTDRILKLRQNTCDDGETGYFPFVSLFGGARASLNPGPSFKFGINQEALDGDSQVRSLLKGLDTDTASPDAQARDQPGPQDSGAIDAASTSNNARSGLRWRPLSERFEDYYAEQLAYDLADERRLTRRLQRRNGRRRRGEYDPYDLLRHSGDGTGVRGPAAIVAGGMAGALGEEHGLVDGTFGSNASAIIQNPSAGASLLSNADDINVSSTAGSLTTSVDVKSRSIDSADKAPAAKQAQHSLRTKAGRREAGKGPRPMPLLKKKKKSKKAKQAAAEKAKETKRRRKEEEEAAAQLSVQGAQLEADLDGEEDEAGVEVDYEQASSESGSDSDDAAQASTSSKRPRLSPQAGCS